MLKKTMTYSDVDGNPVTEDFYFNLNRAELVELQASMPGDEGMMGYLTQVVQSKNNAEIFRLFKMIIGKCYGRRSEDGKSFVKKQEYLDEFFGTEAFSDLVMGFFQDTNSASDFINSVMPAGLAKEAQKTQTVALPAEKYVPAFDADELPAWQLEGRLPTKAEISKMSPDEIVLAMNAKIAKK